MTRVGGLRTLPVECITYIKFLSNGVIICFFKLNTYFFVSSLIFRSIFKKWDNFLEISLKKNSYSLFLFMVFFANMISFYTG